MEKILSALLHCPLFAGMDRAALEALLPQLRPVHRRWMREEALFHPGQMVPGVGIVLSGSIRIVREDFWGSRSLLARLDSGALFGEAFACANVPASVRAEAAEAAETLFLPPDALQTPPPEGTELPGRLLAVLAQKNVMLNRKIDHLSQRTIRAKILSYLSDQAEAAGSPSFSIPLNRQELADYLSVDRSALSAQLGQLRREGMLKVQRSHFTLLSPSQT